MNGRQQSIRSCRRADGELKRMIKSRLYSGSDGYPLPHPTQILFLLPVPSTRIFLHFRVQGSSYTCRFQSRIISTMMPANQLRRKRNSLKIVKIERNAEHKPTHLEWIYGIILLFFLCLLAIRHFLDRALWGTD